MSAASTSRASACPVCEGAVVVDDTDRWRSGDPARDHTVSRCTTCSTVFVDPVPPVEVLAAAYPDDFYGRRRGETERVEEWFLTRRVRRVAPLAGRRVLDVGSGDGKFLRRARAAGAAEVCGVEPSATGRAASASLDLETVADLADLPAGRRFDVITLWHVFEHVPDPRRLAADLAARLAAGGRLLLAVPDAQSFEAQRYRGDWFHLDLPRHLVFPPPAALRALLAEHGLHHVSTSRFSIEYDPYGLLQSWWNRHGARHNALYHRLKRKQPLAAYDRRGRAEVVAGLLTLPLAGPLAVAASAALARSGRTGTYTSIFERPAA